MNYSKLLLLALSVALLQMCANASAPTGYEYDAEYSGGKMTCTNTTHFDLEGTVTGYSITCQKDKELVKMVEKLACFPANAMLEFDDETSTTMDQLKVGDRVKVDADTYETVIGWLHYDPTGNMTVICLAAHSYSNDKYEVCASEDHFIPSMGKLVRFGDVKVGDLLSNAEDNDNLQVVSVYAYSYSTTGVFAPATPSGKLIVNGVLVSTYAYIAPNSLAKDILNQVLTDVPFEQCNIEGVHCIAYLFMRALDFIQTVLNSLMSILFIR